MTSTLPERRQRVMQAWRTPIYQGDHTDATPYNAQLQQLILSAEERDTDAANFGGIDAIKSSQDILRWDHPAITWLRERIAEAVAALTRDTLGDAASKVTQPILAEGWAVVYRGGGSLRPHTHHDSVWSGVYYVQTPPPSGEEDAGHLQLLDPRPAALARGASAGVHRVEPVPGRMVGFPGWLPHSVQATVPDGGLRICVAWNVAYDKRGAAS